MLGLCGSRVCDLLTNCLFDGRVSVRGARVKPWNRDIRRSGPVVVVLRAAGVLATTPPTTTTSGGPARAIIIGRD